MRQRATTYTLREILWPRSIFRRVGIYVVIPIFILLVNNARWHLDVFRGSPCEDLQARPDIPDAKVTSYTGKRTAHVLPAPKPSRSGHIWTIKQGDVVLKLDLGEKVQIDTKDPLQHAGEDCYPQCPSAGLCLWCGFGNACCRKDWTEDPEVCRTAKAFKSGHHECVAVNRKSYPHARVTISHGKVEILSSPANGLFSVGYGLKKGWPREWNHSVVEKANVVGPWLKVSGSVSTPDGTWAVNDRWRIYDEVVEGFRSWTWSGKQKTKPCVLSVQWQTNGGRGNGLMMPAVSYFGNPSGHKNLKNGGGLVPAWLGEEEGEQLQVEEHRLAQTWASFEWKNKSTTGARVVGALDSQPSAPSFAKISDLTWTIGAEMTNAGAMLQLLSGPVALNGKRGSIKTGQNQRTSLHDVGLEVPADKVVQKRYRIHVGLPSQKGAGFRIPLGWTINHGDTSSIGMPRIPDILDAKVRFAMSRWAGNNAFPGFAMYPGDMNTYVMGWAGQAEAPGYALQVLADRIGQPELREVAIKALDVLANATFNEDGFKLKLDGVTGAWSEQDSISQGQAMSKFAFAIRHSRKNGVVKQTWEAFLRRACSIHSARILQDGWHPRSTAEGFLIQPLALASELLQEATFLKAALKAGDHYAARHIGLKEPFWGGTLDASCEDKEGVWAGFEAFLALQQVTGEKKWLDAANYAADMMLTYTYTWDVPMPPGRLRDHDLKTRGWTAVSVQNMHLDVYGVLYTPQLWRLGELSNRSELLQLAELMYRSCGQMLDEHGSQGEQLQQTRFAQAGDLSNPDNFRGGYVESWTVFWIAGHFLTAAAQFEEMGVLSDLWTRP